MRFLVVGTAAKETMGVKASHRVGEGEKVQGALKNECEGRSLSVRVKMGVFDGLQGGLCCYVMVYRECCAVK